MKSSQAFLQQKTLKNHSSQLSICIFKLHIHAATNAVFIAFAVTVCFKVILPIGMDMEMS